MDKKKPERGTEAALIAHLHEPAEEIRKRRGEFEAANRTKRLAVDRTVAADRSERRSHRKKR
jgi:hypothetical protein